MSAHPSTTMKAIALSLLAAAVASSASSAPSPSYPFAIRQEAPAGGNNNSSSSSSSSSSNGGYPASLTEWDGNNTCVSSDGQPTSGFEPALYSEALRPQFHFSPSTNFMNDPNGLVYSNGTWHLFYQYNPREPVAGFQHWGHAVSK